MLRLGRNSEDKIKESTISYRVQCTDNSDRCLPEVGRYNGEVALSWAGAVHGRLNSLFATQLEIIWCVLWVPLPDRCTCVPPFLETSGKAGGEATEDLTR